MPYLGKSPSQGVRSRYQFTPNAGTTSLSGADANGDTMTFTDGNYVDVYLNGVMLKAGVDYVTTTANTIGSLAATVASDVVDVIVYDTFSLFGGTLEGNVKVNNGTFNVTGATDLDSTLNVDGNATFVNDVSLAHDGAVLNFGADSEVALTHVHDVGLNLTGKLGINAATPSPDYGTDSAIEIKGATSPGLVINDTGQGSKYGIHADSNDLKITYGTNILTTFQNDGAVGIGVTDPDHKIEILGANGNQLKLNNGSERFTQLTWCGNDAQKGAIWYDATNTDFVVNTQASVDFVVQTGGSSERMKVTSGGTVVIGSGGAADTTLSGATPPLQVIGTGSNASIAAVRREANAYGSSLMLAKSRNTSVGSYTALADNDALGYILFIGDDGTDLDTYGATIHAEVNGTPGSNDMPADLVFSVNSGSASATERMRLTFNQYDASELYVTSANSSESNANAWVRTKSKGYYWNGLNMESSDGNVGSILGKYQSSSPEIKFFIGGTGPATGTDALIIDGSANVNVITGNLKISTSGKGIDFSATGQASGNTSELLDDYEEGTWTPVYMDQSNSSNPTITYDGQAGTYTKIGNICFAHFHLGTDSVSGGSSSVMLGIGGLPFTSASDDARGHLSIGFKYDWPGTQPAQGSVFSSSTITNLWQSNNAGSNITTNDLGTGANSNRMNGTIIYKTA